MFDEIRNKIKIKINKRMLVKYVKYVNKIKIFIKRYLNVIKVSSWQIFSFFKK
jgi:hypothetical protein